MGQINLSDYVPLLDRVLQHWQNAEAKRKSPIVLADGTTLGKMQALRQPLIDAQNAHIRITNDRESAASRRDSARQFLFAVGAQFNRHVRNVLPGTEFVLSLPAIPSRTSDPERQLTAFRDILDIWLRIEGSAPGTLPPSFTAPLTVRITEGNDEREVDRMEFAGAVDNLAAASQRWEASGQDEADALAARDTEQQHVEARVVAYRKAIRGLYPPDSPTVKTLP